MFAETFLLDGCKFTSDSRFIRLDKISKPLTSEAIEKFEAETYLSIASVLSNRAIRILTAEKTKEGFSFGCSIEDGNFNDVANALPIFKKLLSLDNSLFSSYIDSAQLFHRSLLMKDIDFSVAFSLLVFSLESISNQVYGRKNKKRHMIRFAKHYIPANERFLKNEIRQLEFDDTRRMEALYKKMLGQSYQLRCDFVHDAKILAPLNRIAERLSMAFISNDGVQLFPSYSWLRRITHMALRNFLEQEESKGNNTIESYFKGYEMTHFKIKRAPIQKGQLLTENDLHLQQLKEF